MFAVAVITATTIESRTGGVVSIQKISGQENWTHNAQFKGQFCFTICLCHTYLVLRIKEDNSYEIFLETEQCYVNTIVITIMDIVYY